MESPRRGWFRITERGRELLADPAEDILSTLQEQRGAAALGETLDKVQRDLGQVVRAGGAAPGVDRAQAQAVFTALRTPLPATFVKDLRAIASRYQQDKDYGLLLAMLQKLFDEFLLAGTQATALRPESEPLTRDDLELISYRSLKSGQGSQNRVGSSYERATHDTHGTGG